jgi:hypothetical protein
MAKSSLKKPGKWQFVKHKALPGEGYANEGLRRCGLHL